jgi:hypothetical protein
VIVDRRTHWGNPYVVGEVHPLTGEPRTLEESIRLFRISATQWWSDEWRAEMRATLRGKDLACWCPLEDAQGRRVPCHADVLLELANA